MHKESFFYVILQVFSMTYNYISLLYLFTLEKKYLANSTIVSSRRKKKLVEFSKNMVKELQMNMQPMRF